MSSDRRPVDRVLFVERHHMAASDNTGSASIVTKSTDFVRESVAELKKVTRPTWQETNQATLVSIVIMAVLSLCLFLLDLIFRGVVSTILLGSS